MSKLSEKLRKYRRLAEAFRAFSGCMKNGTYLPDWSLTTASLRRKDADDAVSYSALTQSADAAPPMRRHSSNAPCR